MLLVIYILLGIFIAFVGMQYALVLKSKFNKGKKVRPVEGKLGKMMLRGDRIIMYFYSPSCRACKVQTPIVDKLAAEGHAIQKIDVSRDISLARKFGVMGTPTTVVLDGDTIVEFIVGVKSEDKLRKYLN
ncbi:MAG: thioredoxin family protein [Candidatus Kryptoniota bacterium]